MKSLLQSSLLLAFSLTLISTACMAPQTAPAASPPLRGTAPPTPPAAPAAKAPTPPQCEEPEYPPEKIVADQLYHIGSEGNLGMYLSAKFNSRADLVRELSLNTPVGTLDGRTWVLADIVVEMDFNGNGDVAGWGVSGPTPVVQGYVDRLRRAKVHYDFGAHKVDYVPTHFGEGEEH